MDTLLAGFLDQFARDRYGLRHVPPRQSFFASLAPSYPVSGSPSGAAGGDLTGTYPNPTVAAAKITAAKMSSGAATSGQAPIADGLGGVAYGTVAAGSLTKIARVLRGSNGVISFTNIDQSFAHLLLVLRVRANDGSAALLHGFQFNGDTGSNYASQQNQGSSTTLAGTLTSSTFLSMNNCTGTGSSAGVWGAAFALIPMYADTVANKTLVGLNHETADPKLAAIGGRWANTAAITQIDLVHAFGNSWVTSSCVDLYGLASAA